MYICPEQSLVEEYRRKKSYEKYRDYYRSDKVYLIRNNEIFTIDKKSEP